MTQKLILLTLLFIPFLGSSKGKEYLPSVWVIKDSISKSIPKDSVRLVFHVMDQSNQLMLNQHSTVIQMKVDGKMKKFTIKDKKRTFKLSLSNGKHNLSFFINANFEELHFNQELIGGHYYEIGMNFEGSASSGRQIMVEKPVIYLYSEADQPFSLKIKTAADLQFTYPNYESEWKGIVSKNGTIQMNGSNYPYLFWDASLSVERLKLNWSNADQIQGVQVIDYLINQLNYLGMNEKEKTDFITYWGPRMQQMKYIQVLWIQNDALNPIATLDISPSFNQNRIYLVFQETSQPVEHTLELRLNPLKPMNRSGNYLIEWGGIEVQSNL
jgi:phosphopantetheinyl transferase (holo-ACP synthase)